MIDEADSFDYSNENVNQNSVKPYEHLTQNPSRIGPLVFSPSPVLAQPNEITSGDFIIRRKTADVANRSPHPLPLNSPGFLLRSNSNPFGIGKLKNENNTNYSQKLDYQLAGSPLIPNGNSVIQGILQKDIKRAESNVSLGK